MDLTVLLTARQVGGHETALLGWLRDAVANEGLRPTIICIGRELADACDRAALPRTRLPADPRWLWRALRQAPRTSPLLLAPGVLHAQAWLLAATLSLGHRVWAYVPMTHRAAAMGYRWAMVRDTWLGPVLRRVHGWITIDDHQRARLHDDWGVTAPVHVLPNRARIAMRAAGAMRREEDAPLRVACVGRFDAWQKGLDWLAAGIAADATWARNRRWLFQGRGPAAPMLQALAACRAGIQVLPHGPLEPALAQADVLLLPSRYEGLPLVALEATALGWPVVASRQAGLEALLPAGSCFEFGDHAALTHALATLQPSEARRTAVIHAQARLAALEQPERYAAGLRTLVQCWRQTA